MARVDSDFAGLEAFAFPAQALMAHGLDHAARCVLWFILAAAYLMIEVAGPTSRAGLGLSALRWIGEHEGLLVHHRAW